MANQNPRSVVPATSLAVVTRLVGTQMTGITDGLQIVQECVHHLDERDNHKRAARLHVIQVTGTMARLVTRARLPDSTDYVWIYDLSDDEEE